MPNSREKNSTFVLLGAVEILEKLAVAMFLGALVGSKLFSRCKFHQPFVKRRRRIARSCYWTLLKFPRSMPLRCSLGRWSAANYLAVASFTNREHLRRVEYRNYKRRNDARKVTLKFFSSEALDAVEIPEKHAVAMFLGTLVGSKLFSRCKLHEP